MSDAVVLLSGGQDSTTALGWALEQFRGTVRTLTIDYGQRHQIEVEAAREVANHLKVSNEVLSLGVLHQLGDSALIRGSEVELSGVGGREDAQAPGGLPTTFVPGRNLLFLSLAAAYAVKHGTNLIVTGVCQTDYSGYPDCRREFIDALEKTLNLAMPSSCGPFTIFTPLMDKTKKETVEMAVRIGPVLWAALGKTITCYHGVHGGCGTCPACRLRAKGFQEAGYEDPAVHGISETGASPVIT